MYFQMVDATAICSLQAKQIDSDQYKSNINRSENEPEKNYLENRNN